MKCQKKDRFKDISIPFYLYHGDSDDLADISGSRIKSKHLINQKSKYIEYHNMNHYLYEENNKIEQANDIIQWLNSMV